MALERTPWLVVMASAAPCGRATEAVAPSGKANRQRERGDSLVELALILPVLLLILIAILDLGRAVYAYHVVANCAREGARYGVVSGRTSSQIEGVVKAAAVGLDPSKLTVTVSNPTADTVRVEVDYRFELITPLVAQAIGHDTLVLHSAATMYKGY